MRNAKGEPGGRAGGAGDARTFLTVRLIGSPLRSYIAAPSNLIAAYGNCRAKLRLLALSFQGLG